MKNKAKTILRQLTLEEKIALCEGVSFWETKAIGRVGLPEMFLCDGPLGLRKQGIRRICWAFTPPSPPPASPQR